MEAAALAVLGRKRGSGGREEGRKRGSGGRERGGGGGGSCEARGGPAEAMPSPGRLEAAAGSVTRGGHVSRVDNTAGGPVSASSRLV